MRRRPQAEFARFSCNKPGSNEKPRIGGVCTTGDSRNRDSAVADLSVRAGRFSIFVKWRHGAFCFARWNPILGTCRSRNADPNIAEVDFHHFGEAWLGLRIEP